MAGKRPPGVRLSILDPGGTDQINRPENEFPLARTQYQKLFLDAATGRLSPNPLKKESATQYKADDGKGQATFTIKFDEDTEIAGPGPCNGILPQSWSPGLAQGFAP